MSKYNGWNSRETWLVNLWGMFEGWDTEVSADELEEIFTESVEMEYPELASGASLVTDLFNTAVGAIDWHELADSINEQLEED